MLPHRAYVIVFLGVVIRVLCKKGEGESDPTMDPYIFCGGIIAVSFSFGLPMIGAHERG